MSRDILIFYKFNDGNPGIIKGYIFLSFLINFLFLNIVVQVIITAQILQNVFNSNELSSLNGRLKISFPLGKSSSPLTHASVLAAIKVHLILVSSGMLTLQRYLCWPWSEGESEHTEVFIVKNLESSGRRRAPHVGDKQKGLWNSLKMLNLKEYTFQL